jgi:hypothetical protein
MCGMCPASSITVSCAGRVVADHNGGVEAACEHLNGWTVMNRLGEITVSMLVLAGRDDFIFPPEHQRELAAAIPAHACSSSTGQGITRTLSSRPRWCRPQGLACRPATR